jgi:mannose-1-phosphate guanylyltransferase
MSPTRAMILAAGLGTRMAPLSQLRPKPALPVLNRPLLGRLLDHLAAQGVTLAVINTHALPEQMERAARTAAPPGMQLQFSHEPSILGTGGGLGKAAGHFAGEPLYLVNADSLTDVDLREAWEAHTASGRQATMIVRPHEPGSGYRPVSVVGAEPTGRVCRLAGRKWGEVEGWPRTFTGIHILEPSVLAAIPDGASDINADVYPRLLDENHEAVGAWLHEGWWFEAGSPARYLELNLQLLERSGARRLVDAAAQIHPEAQVARSIIGAGARVGRGAQVVDSVIWDGAVVGDEVSLRRCIVSGRAPAPRGTAWVDTIFVQREDQKAYETAPLPEVK